MSHLLCITQFLLKTRVVQHGKSSGFRWLLSKILKGKKNDSANHLERFIVHESLNSAHDELESDHE